MDNDYDIDALLLLATTLAAKRRPGALDEILAAIDLAQVKVPAKAKLIESFRRLASIGLICQQDDCFGLTPAGELLMENQLKPVDSEQRLLNIRSKLLSYQCQGDHPAVKISMEQLIAATDAQRESAKSKAKNMFAPKPKPATTGPGARQRKALAHKRKG